MAKNERPDLLAPSTATTIYTATLESRGRVLRWKQISFLEAVQERLASRNIVVCDGAESENRKLVQQIESAVGPYIRQSPHASAGLFALPHFQQKQAPSTGHSFYETDRRKAARNP